MRPNRIRRGVGFDSAFVPDMILRSVCVAAVLVLTGHVEVRAASRYLDDLVAQARDAGLAEDPAWRTLGHYRPDLLGGGWHSLIDSAGFFLAADGKHDPAAELEATLRAFFASPSDDPDQQHPQCAYIARYRWLDSRLRFDPDRLPEQTCARFTTWSETIDAASATLIFPAAYLNNPASMFGHTLLRFDRPNQSEQTRLLSYAVNYGADTGTDNGLLFAVLGLTGGYPGTYSVEPYYSLVKRYSDVENRDIWEYQLDFSKAEVERMLAHLWEMRGHHSDYYFFDENCSYQLLFLLDVARPTLNLVDDFALHVVPIDSVRAVLERKDLLRRTVFRPSRQTRIRHNLAALDPPERTLVQRLAAAEIDPKQKAVEDLSPSRRAAVLELAEAFVTYQMETGDLERDAAAARAWSLLAARSRIDVEADQPPVAVPETRPDQGHGSARLALGLGTRDGRFFQFLRLRPVYHDDLDPSGGYVPGAGIEFMDVELRHYREGAAVTLDQVTVVGIRSMAPKNELIRPVSWKLKFGLERMRVEASGEEGALAAFIEGGAGMGYAVGERDIWSATLDLGVSGGEDCAATCSVNVGPALSLTWPFADRATLSAEGRFQLRFGDETDSRYQLRVGQSYGFTRNIAIKLEAGLEDEGAGPQSEFMSSLNWYF